MRWNLLKTYDKIYTIDLHGNSKKKETAPDGSADENVFDIQQGVSINLFVKTGKKKTTELGKVFHYDLYGKRELKYDFLLENSLKSIPYQELPNVAPNFYFVSKDFEAQESYDKGFSIKELFPINSLGIATARDRFTIHDTRQEVFSIIDEFLSLSEEKSRLRFDLGKDARDWQVKLAKDDLEKFYPDKGVFTKIAYRPFDYKWTYYTGNSKGFHCFPRGNVMKHLLRDNIAINLIRRSRIDGFVLPFITKLIVDKSIISTLDNSNTFPLYLYPHTHISSDSDQSIQQSIGQSTRRTPNLNMEIVNKIADNLGLTFVPEKNPITNQMSNSPSEAVELAPIDILDYIYAVLHSPSYREKYKEFLKIDFPRVPYPEDRDVFWELVKLGGELRRIHLLESPVVNKYVSQYPVDGNNVVGKPRFVSGQSQDLTGKVYINETQYFDNVPQTTWEMYIGGYQPVQKWLKDRKGCTLEFDDILHYQKIVVALKETARIMEEIDKIEME